MAIHLQRGDEKDGCECDRGDEHSEANFDFFAQEDDEQDEGDSHCDDRSHLTPVWSVYRSSVRGWGSVITEISPATGESVSASSM